MMTTAIAHPADVSRAFDARLSAGNLDGLMELFTPDAILRTPEGELVSGQAGIREVVRLWITLGTHLAGEPRLILPSADHALLVVDWTLRLAAVDGQPQMSGVATHVAVKQRESDGWRLSVLNPFGVA